MATKYKLRPYQLFQIPNDDKETLCKMCFCVASPDESGMRLGPLYLYGNPIKDEDEVEVYCAHYFCLLFSSGLEQRGEDEEVGLKGFLPEDILKEWRRGQRLKCTTCKQKYSTVGCSAKSCRKTFHLPCAVRSKALLQYCDDFSLFCLEHRPKQAVFKSKKAAVPKHQSCGICSDDLFNDADDNIWSPCCNKWFHKQCVQHFAETSGYFFKCPLCNNKTDFEEEMKRFGIYVPEKDAEWELEGEGQAFHSLLERYDQCDAEECLCPEGRKKDEDYTEWEIILCWYCGAQGMHIKCGNLPITTDAVKWRCKLCTETIKKMPPRTVHHLTPIKLNRKSSNKLLLQNLLSKTKIELSEENKISFKVHDNIITKDERRFDYKLKYSISCQLNSGKPHADIPWKVQVSKTANPVVNVPSSPVKPQVVDITKSPRKAVKSEHHITLPLPIISSPIKLQKGKTQSPKKNSLKGVKKSSMKSKHKNDQKTILHYFVSKPNQ